MDLVGHDRRQADLLGERCQLRDEPVVIGLQVVAELVELARRAGLPMVVTNEVHYADPDGHRLQGVLVCIRHGATLEEAREL
ncbi:MAG TPA: hypothetical protein VFN76_06875, partial [Candidatus Limnocylindria bacterium]|nr:hypothetical protein [Candidatus Limnocylindria bacterium]